MNKKFQYHSPTLEVILMDELSLCDATAAGGSIIEPITDEVWFID